MTALLSWLTGRLAGPLLGALAALFALGFLWQTAKIDGWPLLGGGYRAEVAGLQHMIDTEKRAGAEARADAEAAQARARDAADKEAAANARANETSRTVTQTIIRKVPVYVTEKSDSACVVPWGFVRLLDAAIAGADPGSARARIAPGEPDDAASDVKLSEIVALLAADFGAANENADQLSHLEAAVKAGAK